MASRRYHQIDLLRSVACAMVVGFHYLYRGHAGGWVPFSAGAWIESIAKFGYVGVHLFFAISGFVIFLSAKAATPREFVASRISRLYPAYWVAIALTVVAVRLGSLPDLVVPWRDVLLNLTMFPHWFGAEFVDGAYWSLAVELHFYIMVWVALKLRMLHRAPIWMMGWLALSAINLLRPVYPLEWTLNVQWAPYFCVGICAYLIRSEGASARLVRIFWVAALLCVAYAYRKAQKVTGMTQQDWVIVSALVALIPILFWLIARGHFEISGGRALYWAGALTYPVYLLHEYIGYVAMTWLHGAAWPAALIVLTVLAGVLALAWTVHTLVEKRFSAPIRRAVAGAT